MSLLDERQRCRVGHDHVREPSDGPRGGELHSGAEHCAAIADGDADDCWKALQGHPVSMHVHARRQRDHAAAGRWQRQRGGDDRGRLRVDEQEPGAVDGDHVPELVHRVVPASGAP